MNDQLLQLARFIVRFQALCFAIWLAVDLTEAPSYYRQYVTVFQFRELAERASQEFAAFCVRLGLEALAACIFFLQTDKIISLVTRGRWAEFEKGAIQPPQQQRP